MHIIYNIIYAHVYVFIYIIIYVIISKIVLLHKYSGFRIQFGCIRFPYDGD